MNLNHLTDEQFADLLAGDHSDACARLHLKTCAACREELTSMTTAVGDLNFASLRWAEQRAARIQVPSRRALNWHLFPGWGATVTAALIFGVAVGAHMQTSDHVESTRQPAHAVPAPSDDELAQDNQLMRSINTELSKQSTAQVLVSAPDSITVTQHSSIPEVSN